MTEPVPTSPYPLRWFALAAVLAAVVMDQLDATIVGVAAPSIRHDLGGTGSTIQWLAAGYTLAFAIGLISGGRLGDLYGRRRMFLLGLTGFVLMSALCGLAGTAGLLIAFRVIQGLFGAVLVPQGFGIIRTIFDEREMGTALGVFGPTIALAVVGGPILAGALIAWDFADAGWRTIFLINVPIGLAGLALAAVTVPDSRSDDANQLDPLGTALASAGVAMLVFPLVQGRELGWPAWTFVLMALSVPVLAGFAVHQVRRRRAGRSPLVEPGLFTSRAFTEGLVVVVVFSAAMTGLVFAFGLYLQIGLGWSALRAGLTQAPWAAGIAVGAALSATVLGRRFGRRSLQAGAVLAALGVAATLAAFTAAGADVTPWQPAPALLVTGVGMGLLIAPLFDIVLAAVSPPMVGSGSGVLNATQQLGSTAGIAALGTMFFGRLDRGDALGGLQSVLATTAALILSTAVLAFLLPRHARESDAATAAADDPASADEGGALSIA